MKRHQNGTLRGFTLSAMAAACVGCAGSQAKISTDLDAGSEASGSVAYEFLVNSSTPPPALPENQEIYPPLAVKTPLPIYPPRAFEAGAAPATVDFKILIGQTGRVSEVLDVDGATSAANGFEPEFRAAARNALDKWVFSPGSIRRFEPGADLDGDGTPDYRIQKEKVPFSVYYDLRFHFEIVDGVGRVEAGLGK